MRLGISSYTYTWAVGVPGHAPAAPLRAVDLVERAVDLDVDLLQIADNLPLDRMPKRELAELEATARSAGVDIEVGTRGIEENHLRRYLELAQRFRSPIVRVVVDTADSRPSPEEVVREVRKTIGEFEHAGVSLAIENHDRFRVSELAAIVGRLQSPAAGVCLDTVNSFGSLEGPEVVGETLAPLTINLHVKDFTVRRVESQMGFTIEGCPAGQGRLDIEWLLGKLRAYGRDPNAILELWTTPAGDLEATLAREADAARASIGYLRKWIPPQGRGPIR